MFFSIDIAKYLVLNTSENMKTGLSITIVGIAIVFTSLILLYFCMRLFIYLLEYSHTKHQSIMTRISLTGRTNKDTVPGEVVTAISLALRLSREEFHDMEKTIITLQRITKPYSPWSSKIHGIQKPARFNR